MNGSALSDQIIGSGQLEVSDARGPCRYRLELWPGSRLGGDGWLSDGHELLEQALEAGAASLTLSDGRTLRVTILGLSGGTARVSVVDGPSRSRPASADVA